MMGHEESDRHPAPVEQIAALARDLRILNGRLRRRLREQSSIGDLRPSQLSALLCLEREQTATVSALARTEGMRPQSMAPIVSSLEAAGLVQGTPDPADGRQTLFALTPLCRERFRLGRAAREDWLTGALRSRFSAAERAVLERAAALLDRLVAEA